ncbi:hypothetical protein TI39_contig520g00001, partial [Zymoseptoria brevis]
EENAAPHRPWYSFACPVAHGGIIFDAKNWWLWYETLELVVLHLPSLFCYLAKSHRPGFSSNHKLESGGRTRLYAVNVPDNYNDCDQAEWPLIIDYHGNRGNPKQQWNNSLYYKYPQGQEYLVVYPQGVNGSWQGPTYAVAGVDDLQFTTDLVARLQEEYCIDTDRLYASGKSNGGGFVDTLACFDHGDQFAAFAMAAAALYTDTSKSSCTKKRAILESHGVADATIPYHPNGKPGAGGPLPDIVQWVSWWAHRTCGDLDSESARSPSGYNTTMYSCNGLKDVVQHYQVFDLGHCWPNSRSDNYDASSALDQTKRKCLDRSLDFTPVVLDFFSRWNSENKPR